jgi:hypothetical protein
LQSAGQKESSEESQRVVIVFFFSALVRDQCASLSLSLSLSVSVSLSHRVEKIFVSFLVQQVEISGENWN